MRIFKEKRLKNRSMISSKSLEIQGMKECIVPRSSSNSGDTSKACASTQGSHSFFDSRV